MIIVFVTDGHHIVIFQQKNNNSCFNDDNVMFHSKTDKSISLVINMNSF